MIQFFIGAWNWIKDPKNRRVITLLGVVILVAIILMQCSQNRGLNAQIEQQKSEFQRQQNNNEVNNSPLIQSKINDSTLRAERLAFKLTVDELKKSHSDLLIGFESFKKQNAIALEKIGLHNTETIREVPVYVKIDSLGNNELVFNDTANFKDGNYRKLNGILPYSSLFFNKKDSTQADINKLGLYSKIKPGPANFTLEQGINLKVGLFEDSKTHKVSIAATTSYPGVTFTKLEGADIMSDPNSRKATRALRKTWGIGFTLGYGGTVDLKTSKMAFGPQVGVGLHYTPKWLQWGK